MRAGRKLRESGTWKLVDLTCVDVQRLSVMEKGEEGRERRMHGRGSAVQICSDEGHEERRKEG